MKTVAAVALALATINGALSQSVSLPQCGAQCIVTAVGVTTCSASDFVCLCTNNAFISQAVNCINTSCSASDAQNAYAYATYACASVGITVPSVSSVLNPGGSSSSAAAAEPSTAAASSAAPGASTSAAPAASSAAATTGAAKPSTNSTSSSGSKPHTSAMVTFQGSAPSIVGIEKGIVAAVVIAAAAVIGVGLF